MDMVHHGLFASRPSHNLSTLSQSLKVSSGSNFCYLALFIMHHIVNQKRNDLWDSVYFVSDQHVGEIKFPWENVSELTQLSRDPDEPFHGGNASQIAWKRSVLVWNTWIHDTIIIGCLGHCVNFKEDH